MTQFRLKGIFPTRQPMDHILQHFICDRIGRDVRRMKMCFDKYAEGIIQAELEVIIRLQKL